MRIIYGIEIGDREHDALKVQEALTKYGCIIKTRLGLHEAGNLCSSKGLIILEFINGNEDEIDKLEKELSQCETVKIGKMSF
ncbi:MAG: hypothetical protein N4A76_09545 [Firmicutes bacterium]|jgi:hypothetical protein|nr:hypothetical protein [Bacillota bacterium]